MVKNRISKPITITLSPQAQEALEILKSEEETTNVSYIVDKAIKNHLQGLGYVAGNEMFNEVTAEIISNGVALMKFAHQGQTFLRAPGSKTQYTIRLTNKSYYERKLVVISVDGRSVMTGELANENDTGYVLNPGQVMDLTGWRRTADEVAAFEFVDLEASYDKQVGGTGSNVGVIGIAVFNERMVAINQWSHWIKPYTPTKPEPYVWNHPTTISNTKGLTYRSSNSVGSGSITAELNSEPIPMNASFGSAGVSMSFDSDDVVPSAAAASAETSNYSHSTGTTVVLTSEVIGTGYGEKKVMKTTSVTFDREDYPTQKIVLRYATEPTLKKWGVLKDNPIPQVDPFPAKKPAVPAPPGWRG